MTLKIGQTKNICFTDKLDSIEIFLVKYYTDSVNAHESV